MDPYVYPGTNVLRNLRDIRDLNTLAAFEADATSWRIRQLEHAPKPGKLNLAHLKAIHRHIFQDVYPWSGEFRTVNISRSNQPWFALPEHIVPYLDTIFSGLAKDPAFHREVSETQFCTRAAYYMGELNAVHPFREGNGRTQRELIRTLALTAGHPLSWKNLTAEENNEASRISFATGNNTALATILRKCQL